MPTRKYLSPYLSLCAPSGHLSVLTFFYFLLSVVIFVASSFLHLSSWPYFLLICAAIQSVYLSPICLHQCSVVPSVLTYIVCPFSVRPSFCSWPLPWMNICTVYACLYEEYLYIYICPTLYNLIIVVYLFKIFLLNHFASKSTNTHFDVLIPTPIRWNIHKGLITVFLLLFSAWRGDISYTNLVL